MRYLSPWTVAAGLLALLPLFCFGFAGERLRKAIAGLPLLPRLTLPLLGVVPYLLVAVPSGTLRAGWLTLYLLLPAMVACLLWLASRLDEARRGHWIDFAVLVTLGLAVDLRWLEPAWPHGVTAISKLLLLDAGLYGFLGVRGLDGVGFDLRIKGQDWKTGLWNFVLYAPGAILLGLAIGFLHLHLHPRMAGSWIVPLAWIFSFLFVALPEEIFFRGWMQNLMERRLGARASLVVTSILFGLSHFNKRAAHFNWRYVLLAAIAGLFYGRAWRRDRRIAASAIAHATVDTVWGALLR
ncbi:CPBP family intramembrane glutamic endopeptidase [Acidipila rosea]|uniref:CAAX prenyl protease-like protein n=1 Tax=Acidipila rosea TaxID=768535 RepID=A0A4R1L3T9_9BACT|nr:type II CAAX endopeptidase family protein [Acidipila rosea]TCK72674.1 CAAX prenyl protease-like protein [Acidipila rosea]